MAELVRMADIAERLGISTVSVSKALNGDKGVSEETRQRVLRTAADMGYQGRCATAGSLTGSMLSVS